jgi:hypothetical protein
MADQIYPQIMQRKTYGDEDGCNHAEHRLPDVFRRAPDIACKSVPHGNERSAKTQAEQETEASAEPYLARKPYSAKRDCLPAS